MPQHHNTPEQNMSPKRLMLIGLGLLLVPLLLAWAFSAQTAANTKGVFFLGIYFWPAGIILSVTGLVLYIKQRQ